MNEWMNEWMKSIFLLSQRTFINEKECVMHLNVYDYSGKQFSWHDDVN